MKTTIYATLTALALTFFSCGKPKKNVMDYYPVVKTISAVIQSDGSLLVTGEIVSDGDSPIEYSGFCMSPDPEPIMTDNQKRVSYLVNNRFTAVYNNLDPYTRYYFRSWATNDMGYSYGNIITKDSIAGVAVNPPCSLSPNSVKLSQSHPQGSYISIDDPEEFMGEWSFTGSTGNSGSFIYTFGAKPATRTLVTTQNTPGPNEVKISFYSGSNYGSMRAGDTMYVKQLTPASWEMTVCNASWTVGSGVAYFNTRFICPL